MSISTSNDELKVAGIRLQITGEAEFVQSLQTSAKQSTSLKNELKLLEAQTTSAGKNGTEYLRAKTESLTSSIAAQEERTKTLKSALAAASAEGKTDANVTAELEKSILASELATAKLTRSLTETNTALAKSENASLKAGIAQKEMGEKMEKSGKQISGVGDNLTKYVTAPVLAASAALAALVAKTVESADGIQLSADKYGMSTDRIQELTYAGKGLDVEFDTIAGSQSKLIKAMTAAKDPTTAQGKAFDDLGISVVNSDGTLRDSNEVWGEVIDKIGQMPNQTEASSTAMVLLGKSALDLNPLIKAGSGELAKLTEEAHKNGAVMSGESVAALDEFGDSIEKAKVSIGTAAGEITVKMLPTLNKLLPIVRDDIVPFIGKFAEGVGDLITGFDNLDPIAQGVVATLAGIAVVAGPVLEVVGTGITLYGTMTTAAGVHAIATAADATAVTNLATAETVATGTGVALAATMAPIVILAAALAGTAIAYEVITSKSREATSAVTAVTDEINKSNDAYSKTIADADTSAAATKNMTDKLYALADVENKSNAQKAQMKGLVSSLNSAVPNLSLSYDEQTDSLNKNKDAVYDLIDAKLKQLKSTAYENQITKAYEDQITQADLYAKALDRYNKANEKLTTIMNPIDAAKARGEFEASADALIAVSNSMDGTNAALASAESGYTALADTASTASDTISDTGTAIADTTVVITEAFQKQLDDAKESQQKFYDDMEQATSDYYKELGDINDDGIKQDDLSAKEWQKNYEKRIADMEAWRSGMVSLSGKVPAEMLSYLAELGPGQTKLIQDLVNATPAELEAYIQTWRDGNAEAAQVAKDLSDGLVKAYGNPYTTFYGMGQSTIDGLIAGMKANTPGAYTAATEAAKGVAAAYKKANDQRSPSHVMEKIGANDMEGLIVGYKGKEQDLKNQVRKVANIATGGFGISPAVSLGSIATNQALSALNQSSTSTSTSTVDASVVVSMAGATFNVRSQQDIDQIAEALAARVAASRKAVGND